jgi:P-type Mg2+ transporter
VGIPFDRVDEEYLLKPRRWNIESIKKFMVFIGPMSSIFDYTTFFLMLFFFRCRDFALPGASPALKANSESLFHTGWFVESLLTQTLIVHIIRTNKVPFFQSTAGSGLIFTTLAVMGAAAALPYSPLSNTLGFVPLPGSYWAWIAATLVAYGTLTHFVKTWFVRRYERD